MRIGPFYFDTKELFLMAGALLVALAQYFGWSVAFFEAKTLLTLMVIFLLTKGLLPAIHNERYFILVIATLFLSFYFTLFQVVIFYFVGFLFFRLLRLI